MKNFTSSNYSRRSANQKISLQTSPNIIDSNAFKLLLHIFNVLQSITISTFLYYTIIFLLDRLMLHNLLQMVHIIRFLPKYVITEENKGFNL